MATYRKVLYHVLYKEAMNQAVLANKSTARHRPGPAN
jgi:hypothetical protein